MRRFSDRHSLSTLSELNVTPLLDLAFVLLIIFMITTPLMEKSAPVVLPTDKPAPNAIDPSHRCNRSPSRSDAEIKLNGTSRFHSTNWKRVSQNSDNPKPKSPSSSAPTRNCPCKNSSM